MTASLKYLLITVKVVALAKVSLLISKILRLFVSTRKADDKNYLLYRDNLTPLIKMQFSQKQKTFSEFFFGFLKSMLIFKHSPKSDDRHSRLISRSTGYEKRGYINV